jgi:predicted enzyme related to lactoylglutathione lyase
MFLGLRTVIYPAPDLQAAKEWWTRVLGIAPYFDQPFYVGFSVGGYELALDPEGRVEDGPTTYWGVPDAAQAVTRLVSEGASVRDEVVEVGDGIKVATVTEPSGLVIGVIENPVFALAAVDPGEGPGR